MQSEALHTVGTIAARYAVQVHRVEYAIRARNIQPTSCAGNARVFDDHALEEIASALGVDNPTTLAARTSAVSDRSERAA